MYVGRVCFLITFVGIIIYILFSINLSIYKENVYYFLFKFSKLKFYQLTL